MMMASGSAPPAYSTGAANGDEQAPLGTPEDLALAAKVVRNGARVLAALPVSQRAVDNIPWQTIRTLACLPCFWPHLLCLSPCLVPAAKTTERNMKNTMYIITNESIIIHVADHETACCACTTGRDYSEFPLEYVGSVSVNNVGRGMCSSRHVPFVSTMPMAMGMGMGAGHRGAHGGGGFSMFGALYVDDPDALAEVLRNARAQIKSMGQPINVAQLAGLIQQQPAAVAVAAAPAPAPATAAAKRIFIALSSAPTAFSIFNVHESKTEFESLLMEVRATFSLEKSTPVQLALAEINAVVTNIESLSNNDKLIATVG